MKKTGTKRLLSLLLTLCMLAALLPAYTFALGELSLQAIGEVPNLVVGESGSFEVGLFEGSAQGSIGDAGAISLTVTDPSVVDVSLSQTGDGEVATVDFAAYSASANKKEPKLATLAADGFEIDSDLTTLDVYNVNKNFFTWKDNSLYVMLARAEYQVAVTIPVPADGYYSLGVQGLASTTGATCELSIGDTVMGTYSFYKKSGLTETASEQTLGAVYLKKGSATVVLEKTADKTMVNLTKLALYPIGDTVGVNVVAKKIGIADVTLSGKVGDTPVSYSVKFVVKGEPGVILELEDEDSFALPFNGKVNSGKLILTIDGLPATEEEFELVEAVADDPLLLKSADLRFEDDGVYLDVLPKNTGSTTVKVRAIHAEYGESILEIPLSVRGNEFLYNMLKLHGGGSSNVGTDPDVVTDWDQTTMGSLTELFPAHGTRTDPWIYIGPRPSESLDWGWVEYGLMFRANNVGPQIMFGIDVKESGSYDVSMDSLIWGAGLIYQVYIAPWGTENPQDEQYAVGDPVDSYNEEQINIYNLFVGTTYLEAGKYIYTIKSVGKNDRSSGYTYGFGNIKLTTPKGREFKFTVDREKVMIGREEAVVISPRFNGAVFGADLLSEIVLTNQNGEILDADYRVDGEELYLDVKGLTLGTATLTLSAFYGDEVIESDLMLEVVAEDELEFASLTVPVDYADADEEIQVSASATQFDGTVVYPGDENVTFEYTSSNTKVLSVSDTGLIKTKGMGSADVEVFATRGNITKSAKITFTVTSDYPLVSVSLDGLDGVAIGSTAQYRVTGRLENGAPIPDSATITYSIVENDDGAIELSESGLVKGVAEGTAIIKATVTTVAGASMDTNEFTITVYNAADSGTDSNEPKEVLIDMISHYKNGPSSPTAVQLKTAGWQMNTELTDPGIFNLPANALRWQIYGLNIDFKDMLLVLDVNIPGDGYYQVSAYGGQYTQGPHAQFVMNGTYLGEYDMYSTRNLPYGKEIKLNTVYLNKGVQQLYIWRGTHTSESRGSLYFGGMRFTPVEEMPTEGEVDLRATKTTLSVGESGWLLPGVQMSDGTVKRVGYTANREQDADNFIESVTVSGSSIKLLDNYEFTAVTPGTSTVTMVATIDGVQYTKTISITVDSEKITTVNAVLANPNLNKGEISDIAVSAFFGNGREVDLSEATVTFASTDASVAKVVDGVLETYKEGDVQIIVTVELGGESASAILPLSILPSEATEVKIKSPHAAIKPTDEGYQLTVVGVSVAGDEIELPGAVVTWSTNDTQTIGLSEDGFLTPKALGFATVKATVEYQSTIYYPTFTIQVREGKTKATYYTEEKVAAALENIKQYDWARDTKNAAVEEAEKYLESFKGNPVDYFYTNIPTQEVPRGILAGYRWDPNGYTCKFCEVDLRDEFSNYPWLYDPFNYPWKIQCPNCLRRFPSNDFGKFYEAGLDEHKNFSYEKALKEGSHLLTNDLFPEKDEHIDQNGNLVNEGIHGWGVDDSRGYKTGKTYPGQMVYNMSTHYDIDVTIMEEYWPFVSFYNHYGVWSQNYSGLVRQGLRIMRNAYLYTKDPKYGRVGAILVSRVADIYPEMFIKPMFPYMFNSDSTAPAGRQIGCIWQGGLSADFAVSYDAFYDMYDDPYVVNYLSKKAQEFNYGEDYYVPDYFNKEYDADGFKDPNYVQPMTLRKGNDKSTPALIRQNIEENLLLEIVEDIYTGNVFGNFGISQTTAAQTAVVLDTMPYTGELLDWLWIPSDDTITPVTATYGDLHVQGGNVLRKILQTVSRDGTGNEAAPGYNNIWSAELSSMLDALMGYDGYDGVNLFENPKFVMMYKATFPKLMLRHHTVAVGDSGSFHGANETQINTQVFLETKDVEIGQMLYWNNGNTVEGMHGSIFDDSDTLQDEVQNIIDTHGEYDLDKSRQQAAFGLTTLRGGTKIPSLVEDYDSQRYAYIYYGYSGGHGHLCKLDLGLAAFGINMAADFGYPEAADGSYRAVYRDKTTVIHNTVLVDDQKQDAVSKTGFPLHFDDAGRVKIFDVSDPFAYENRTEEYRRSIVNVEVDDMNAYTVDFFRVKGGDEHLYSFHASSNTITAMENLDNLVRQSRGTYAGPDVAIGGYETGGGNNGYDFLYNVERAEYPGGEFSVDFLVDQFMGYAEGSDNYHLKMTQLNDFDLSEVALAKVQPPQKGENPKEIQLVLARREGKDLDTLFTTVFEPYDTESYILSEEAVPMVRIGGAWETENDAAKAVKITLKNGRVDYVVYATNNKVLYSVDDRFEFSGFAGVYTLENDADEKPIYAYLNDGSKIGDVEGVASYTGTVIDFQEDAVLDNYITVKFDGEHDPYRLVGKYINVNNDGTENASYEIKGIEVLENGNVKLDLGYISLVRGMVDELNADKGYTHNIARGQTFTVPLETIDDDSPRMDKIGTQMVTVGDTLEIPLSATTKSGAEVTFKLGGELRNASVTDGKFYFSPTQMQIGKNHASVTAVNGALETTVHFDIEVFAGSSSAGGGGGGGGGSDEEEVTYEDLGNNIFKDSNGNLIDAGPDKTPGTADDKPYEEVVTPSEKFVDLGSHVWAKDAIYRLVDAGVIKGVDDTHYAPASQITRADFAILLVRAWNLTADELGTFEDVAETDYFASEVGIASALGIVKGVGEGKFAPKAPITREQMMVMLSRTLAVVKAEVKEVADDVLESFTDADLISDYAVESVKSMVGNGFIQGANGKINPQGNATRAEVAVLLDRILNK